MSHRLTYKILLIALLHLFGINLLFSQSTPRKINFRANTLEYDEYFMPGVDRFIGNVVFSHEQTIGYCDSAHFYKDRNYMEGFGERIKIVINDSTFLYGKFLTYDADRKLITISKNVILKDSKSVLYTDSLVYRTDTEVGYYITGGKMLSKDNVITSVVGHYYTPLNKIVLKKNVRLKSNQYNMECDSLTYNTKEETAYFISRTKLVSNENTIYTLSGWYNTTKDIALLVDSVELFNKTQHLTGDSIFYDRNLRFGIGYQNVIIVDTAKGYIVKGDYIEHHELGGTSVVTDSSLLILIEEKRDSLFLHADTLKLFFDSLQEPQLIQTYNHVKFYRDDIQGVCDSLVFFVQDSTLIMYHNPVLWSGENQLSADTIRFFMLDSSHIKVQLLKSSFIASSVFEEKEFNQIKGLAIIGYIFEKELTKVNVIGNAECLYFILEEDSSLIGINSSATSEMTILFENNEVSSITFFNSPDGLLYPDKQLEQPDRLLKDFAWLVNYRALTPADIFHTPIPRYKVLPPKDKYKSD